VDGMIGMETADAMALGLEADESHFQKWRNTSIMMDTGDLNNWSVTYENSHFALFECGWQFSAIDMDSIKGYQEMTNEGFEICYKTPFAFTWVIMGEPGLKRMGPLAHNFPDWMRKIKTAFDPDTVADPVLYTTPEKKK